MLRKLFAPRQSFEISDHVEIREIHEVGDGIHQQASNFDFRHQLMFAIQKAKNAQSN